MNQANIITGQGDREVGKSLYRNAILSEVANLRRIGRYVCLANILKELPCYNPDLITELFVELCVNGEI